MRKAFLIGCILLPGLLQGQWKLTPVKKAAPKTKKATRTQGQTPLSLPFWDDFSFSEDVPSDTLWEDSDNVRINKDIGIDPPSLNVASFDGLTATGEPYGFNPDVSGPTDVLTSCPIDLSGLTVNDQVYLSFFYQSAGAGDPPEENQGDSLILEFFNQPQDTSFWVQAWPQNSSFLDLSGDFVQVILRVQDTDMFHENFQFRFRSFGRQSGIWDNWNVDYVYMNENRNVGDLFYPDRTLSSRMTSLFQTYTSIPLKHFTFTQVINPQFTIYNMDDEAQPVRYDLDVTVDNFIDENIVTFSNTVFDPVGSPSLSNTTIMLETAPVLQETLFDVAADSAYINYVLKYATDDNKLPPESDYDPKFIPIDFRLNDTLRSTHVLSTYYAYDDGTAEFGAGFESASTRLAYQFEIPDGITDNLVALDMYFPYLGLDPAGKSIDIFVWLDNNGEPGASLYQEPATAVRAEKIDEFTRYVFRRSIEVSGTFYVGYRQNFEGDLRIGLDRNTNSTSRIFTNTSGFWEQENDLETGSLMIRPVFGPVKIATSVDPEPEGSVSVYPNPGRGVYRINSTGWQILVFDAQGRTIAHTEDTLNGETRVDISSFSDGLYFIQLVRGQKQLICKVLKN